MFFEAEFPKTISYKAMGGPVFNTTINEGFSGFEQRNQNWSAARGEWTVSLSTPGSSANVDPQTYIDQLMAFFLVVGGKSNGFRLKDHKDFTSAGTQFFGNGDGVSSYIQLIRTYAAGGSSYVRTIYKPITSKVVDYLGNTLVDSVGISVNSVPQAFNPGYVGGGTAQFTLDETTGIASFGFASQLAITNCVVANGFATYTFTVTFGLAPQRNQQVVVSGGATTGNNGSFIVSSATATTFTVPLTTQSSVTESSTGTIAASILAITAVSNSGSNTTYTYTLSSGAVLVAGMRVTILNCTTSGNNGTFYIATLGTGTFTVVNASGHTESVTAQGYTDWVPATGKVIAGTFQFHYPVRFDTDNLAIELEESNVEGGQPIITWNSITLRELRIINGQG